MCGVHGDAVVAQPLHRDGWVSSIAIRQLTKPSLPLVARYKRIRLIYIYVSISSHHPVGRVLFSKINYKQDRLGDGRHRGRTRDTEQRTWGQWNVPDDDGTVGGQPQLGAARG